MTQSNRGGALELSALRLGPQPIVPLLLEDFPEADDETILDTLEGITDLHEMLAAIIRSGTSTLQKNSEQGDAHDTKESIWALR